MRRDLEEDFFYQPDNSAIFTAAVTSFTGPFVFRLSCELKAAVDVSVLQTALEKTARRFPYFFVSLKRGVFWHYLDPVKRRPLVERENRFPCEPLHHFRHKPLCRVSAFGRSISCEFHHAVTDGTGAIIFLKALITEYLTGMGVPHDRDSARVIDSIDIDQPPAPEEWEDSYKRYFKKEAALPEKAQRAFVIPGSRLDQGYRATVFTLPLPDCLAKAKEYKATLTELMTAVYMAALQELYFDSLATGLPRVPNIAVQVPVNLRRLYPSITMRNFFLFASPSLDLRLGRWEFNDIVERVHHQMRLGVTRMELYRQMRRNVGGEKNPLGRGMFLPIKQMYLRLMNRLLNTSAYTGSISNLGAVNLPAEFVPYVERFLFLPARNDAMGANVTLLSWQDSLVLGVGSSVEDNALERTLARILKTIGLQAAAETNIPRHFRG